jgi:hypothetical protein
MMRLVAGCVMEGPIVFCQKNILEHSMRFHGDYIEMSIKRILRDILMVFKEIQQYVLYEQGSALHCWVKWTREGKKSHLTHACDPSAIKNLYTLANYSQYCHSRTRSLC